MKLNNLLFVLLSAMLIYVSFGTPGAFAIESYGLPFTGSSEVSIGKIVKTLIMYVGVAAFMSLTYGGILLLLSYGDESKVKSAKNMIMYALIGVVVSGASYLIIDAINSLQL